MIIALNGASSSGKTSLARALQEQWTGPLLYLGIDTAIRLLPYSYAGPDPAHQEGIGVYDEADGSAVVRGGEVWKKVERSFARAVALLANDGHDLVLDMVLFDPTSLATYLEAFAGIRLCFVGVHCELSSLEARECARGDRHPGTARGQANVVHAHGRPYDLEIDTSETSPEDLARRIVRFVTA